MVKRNINRFVSLLIWIRMSRAPRNQFVLRASNNGPCTYTHARQSLNLLQNTAQYSQPVAQTLYPIWKSVAANSSGGGSGTQFDINTNAQMMDLHVLLAQGTLAAQLHMFRPFKL